MAANKVVINGVTKIDLTGDTVTAGNVAAGDTFHLASGAAAAGTMPGLDSVAFGAQPSPPGRGYTDGQYYEAIAEAINRRKSQGPAAQTLTVTRNGTYDAPAGVLYDTVIVNVGEEEEEVPTGQIIQMMGKTAPSGYLACDGTVYNIAAYPALASYFAQQFEAANYWGGDGETTFAVPDLRGEFLRGAGTNAHENQGSGAAVGTHQDGTLHPYTTIHNHTLYSGYNIAYVDNSFDSYPLNKDSENSGYGQSVTSSTLHNNDPQVGDYTSRPTNTSVLYCIKT